MIRKKIPRLEDQDKYRRGMAGLREYRPTPEVAIADIEVQAAMAATVKAMRRRGELHDGAGRPKENSATLAEFLRMSEDAANNAYARWSKVAAIPSKDRARYYGSGVKLASRGGLLSYVKRLGLKPADPINVDGTAIVTGDFRELGQDVSDNSVALIFTDPPYDRKSLPLYEDLFDLASRVLIPGGSLICYCGHYLVGEILSLPNELKYWWLLACVHQHGRRTFPGKYVYVGWKPMLWFVKGSRRDRTVVRDTITDSELPDKSMHDWAQSETEAHYYIEQLTENAENVLDPMCGDGTTLVAAKRLGRVHLGFEIEEKKANEARARLAAAHHDNTRT